MATGCPSASDGGDGCFPEPMTTSLRGVQTLPSFETRRVLDVGCGTGTLAVEAYERFGGARRVIGIDPDPTQITRARSQAGRKHASVVHAEPRRQESTGGGRGLTKVPQPVTPPWLPGKRMW
jgi:precorrin-6B methylase 2